MTLEVSNVATETDLTFTEVSNTVDFPKLERDLLKWWKERRVVEQYLTKNDGAEEQFSFIDGPITANNPMGVHHAWGRTYKDLFQRYHAMLGKEQRFQNGFDCQGLWVEVEVEKELGLKNKREIEDFGIANFVERCKERVWKYAAVQTEQAIRLGQWMDWDNSYYTMSDENNYTIWHFLKTCHDRGWIYKGHDVMPWCPRCGTGLSEHEIVTEGYQERTHLSVYVALPLDGEDASLLVWTTTPWTLAANVAAAVNPALDYLLLDQDGKQYYVAKDAAMQALKGDFQVVSEVTGADLVGKTYRAPFDSLPANAEVIHRVIAWSDVSSGEGTGIVHIAPGAGKEDYALSKEHDLQVIDPINQFGVYVEGFGWLSDEYVHDVATRIERELRDQGVLYRSHQYTHRYPVCWRCNTDLVFRLVDEWFINMDGLRDRLMEVTREINWFPSFGKERELDWLTNMDDWMISKKRYWGLALPIWVCDDCEHFDVIGSEIELKDRAVEGWDEFEGQTPHRPYIDHVKIECSECGGRSTRTPDVGNPWLDAGIVAMSTLEYRHDRDYWEKWYPADLITESFPGQFRNWFYALLAESTAIADEKPFRNVFTYALMRDEHGEEMHKSKGNAIWFDDAAEEIGVDVMRWLFSTVTPSANMNFGYHTTDEVRRRFILPLWNSYSFFVTYARLDGWTPDQQPDPSDLTLLDRWILSRVNQLSASVRERMDAFDPTSAARQIEHFIVEELSNWYIRRNRRRFWKPESDADKVAAYATLYKALTTSIRLMAPFVPFITEEIYQNLVAGVTTDAPKSVHLTDYPAPDHSLIDENLSRDMTAVIQVVKLGRAARSEANIKVRQPLPAVLVHTRDARDAEAVVRLKDQILEELNVKHVRALEELSDVVAWEIKPNLPVLGPKFGKRLGRIRQTLSALNADTVAEAVNSGQQIVLGANDGEEIVLQPDEVLVGLRKREGFAAAQGDGTTVALDTELTEELIQEGLARDFVRSVQDARKKLDLRVEQKIALAFASDDAQAVDAITNNQELISREVLASELSQSAELDGDALEVKVGDATVRVLITPNV
ncbi:isoleucine--tRNA ligase [soil metagenome]